MRQKHLLFVPEGFANETPVRPKGTGGVLGSWCPEEHGKSKIPAWKKKLLQFLAFQGALFFLVFSTQSTPHWWSIERIKKLKLSTIESRINYPRRSKEQYSCFSLVYASPPTEWSHCPPSLAACSLISIFILMSLSPPFSFFLIPFFWFSPAPFLPGLRFAIKQRWWRTH